MKKKASGFEKFARKKSNAAIKEQFKQEKRKWKKEKQAFFEQKKAEKAGTLNKQEGTAAPAKPVLRKEAGQMPLNKFLAHSGVAARREAADLIKEGLVKVNGKVVTEPGFKVSEKDEIQFRNKKVILEKTLVYILLNKPKDYLTTTDDPQKRKTVLDLVKKATKERIYPVGRLDRNTSGVLLLTNDGELSQKLTHPSNEVKKVYAVKLDKPLTQNHFTQITDGLTLEDGPVQVDHLAFTGKDNTELGIEIHSGRNRIVRRIFESLGYDVKNLDRVMFAGLTKKNVDRGKWRFLTDREVRELKFFGKGR